MRNKEEKIRNKVMKHQVCFNRLIEFMEVNFYDEEGNLLVTEGYDLCGNYRKEILYDGSHRENLLVERLYDAEGNLYLERLHGENSLPIREREWDFDEDGVPVLIFDSKKYNQETYCFE